MASGRALNLLRASLHYRREAFDAGLKAAGLEVVAQLVDPRPGDVLVIWNRYGSFAQTAWEFERRGAVVVVVENGPLGKHWRGGEWFSLAMSHTAASGGYFAVGGPERWRQIGAEMRAWRTSGVDTLILAQRGIGEPSYAAPRDWASATHKLIGGRIRNHPGTDTPTVSLQDDLERARCVVTWSSGAAVIALWYGVPVFCAYDRWVCYSAARPLSDWGHAPRRDDAARQAAFERLAWSMWTLDEVRTGEPFERLALGLP